MNRGVYMIVIKLKNNIQQAPPDKYKVIEEFYDDMRAYENIIIEYCKQKYVVSYYDDILAISEFNKPDTEQTFTSLEEFAANFLMDGVKFKDCMGQISILVR